MYFLIHIKKKIAAKGRFNKMKAEKHKKVTKK